MIAIMIISDNTCWLAAPLLANHPIGWIHLCRNGRKTRTKTWSVNPCSAASLMSDPKLISPYRLSILESHVRSFRLTFRPTSEFRIVDDVWGWSTPCLDSPTQDRWSQNQRLQSLADAEWWRFPEGEADYCLYSDCRLLALHSKQQTLRANPACSACRNGIHFFLGLKHCVSQKFRWLDGLNYKKEREREI